MKSKRYISLLYLSNYNQSTPNKIYLQLSITCESYSSGSPPLDDKRVQNDQILSLRAIGHDCV